MRGTLRQALRLKEAEHIDWYYSVAECNVLLNKTYPVIDKSFLAVLEAMGLEVKCNFELGDFTYTYAIPSQKVVINLAHNLSDSSGVDMLSALSHTCNIGKHMTYHQESALNANRLGWECIHIFDWDSLFKMSLQFLPKTVLQLSECTISEVEQGEMFLFLDMYHCRDHIDTVFDAGYAHLGIYKGDELIYLITVGKPKYNKSYTSEIYRICSNPEFTVVGGWRALFDTYLSLYQPESVIALRDISKMYQAPYLEMGFHLVSYTVPRKYWAKNSDRLTDGARFVAALKPKRLENYSKCAQNLSIMLEHGYVPIHDCSSAIYEWRSK